MGKLCGKIKIELMSDICAGSGYSYAGVIDSDVSYDEYGIPFIPARRLKGCLREAAELVCPDAAEELFGWSGDNRTRGICLENAHIENYTFITEEIKKLKGAKQDASFYLTPQNILKIYTEIRAQTKICPDTGVAERNTLRYTRVVGQYDPLKSKAHLCFYAPIEFEDTYEEQLRRATKATRNMGMNRNRGLGSVRCSLIDVVNVEMTGRILSDAAGGDERVCLHYVFCNREPLVLSGDNTEVSESYISGKSILGNLAGAYLRMEGTNAEDEEFQELFLDGTTLFTNAYLSVLPEKGKECAAQWPDYRPAPLYLNRLKKTGALVNCIGEKKEIPPEREKEYNTADGNLPKKLKTHYVYEPQCNVFDIVEPEREILYHNSKREQLYSQEVLREGQYFKGKIYTKRKYVPLFKELLKNTRLAFGKSKTAQYGICELAAKISDKNTDEEPVCAKGGEKIAVVMDSDAIFLDGTGGYTVKFEEVKELVGKHFEIPYVQDTDDSDVGSILQTKEVTGYNTTWNLHRPGVPAIKAGSVLVYTIPDGKTWKRKINSAQMFVGERNLEGCGQVRILKCQDMAYAAQKTEDIAEDSESKEKELCLYSCEPLLLRILTEQFLEQLIFLYIKDNSKLNLTPSTIGRMSLMLQESLNAYRSDSEQAFIDFCSRINSIKRKKEKEEAFRLLRSVVLEDTDENKKEEYKIDIRKMTAGRAELQKIWKCICQCVGEEICKKKLVNIWGAYVKNILTYHKYQKKHEGGSTKNEK